jgi:hypothetical protein
MSDAQNNSKEKTSRDDEIERDTAIIDYKYYFASRLKMFLSGLAPYVIEIALIIIGTLLWILSFII